MNKFTRHVSKKTLSDLHPNIQLFWENEWQRDYKYNYTINTLWTINILSTLQEAKLLRDYLGRYLQPFAVRVFYRLITQQCHLNQYSYMIGLSNTPYCQECNEFEDVNHFLIKCRKYTTQRQSLYTKFNNIFGYEYPYHYTSKNILTANIFPTDDVDKALQATYDYIISTRHPI